MSKIDIQRNHSLGRAQARSAVEQIAARMAEKFGVDTAWDGDVLGFSRSGVDGRIVVGDSDVRVTAQLGMMLGMLKGTIEQEIERVLDERLGRA
ncbi:polyhydroxyalkanoic acid system family protein [Coralloluteibacterium thermophilus]|uniref:Polyhydroxyalkanoic acid system family protein n=1 Tax=Coralloluteibacterium thermophilum TaxID=2707049 RepID=A0ABV9NQH7_9GAMM